LSENLTDEIDNFAIYLPAVSCNFAKQVIRKSNSASHSVRSIDLDFANADSTLWSYKWCLASAGMFAYTRATNSITRRNANSSFVMGDSGGYQVAKGTLRGMKRWDRCPENII
jgi:hypothetical protein